MSNYYDSYIPAQYLQPQQRQQVDQYGRPIAPQYQNQVPPRNRQQDRPQDVYGGNKPQQQDQKK